MSHATRPGACMSKVRAAVLGGVCAILIPMVSVAGEADALRLEAKIPLGNVAGRIDHMAIDLARHRLFVAELGNNSVGVVDYEKREVVHRITGLKEPQGVGYASATDTIFIANRRDGSVRIFRAADYSLAARIELNSDADNVRIDSATQHVVVG